MLCCYTAQSSVIIGVSQVPRHLPSASVWILKKHMLFVLQNNLIMPMIDLPTAALTSRDLDSGVGQNNTEKRTVHAQISMSVSMSVSVSKSCFSMSPYYVYFWLGV